MHLKKEKKEIMLEPHMRQRMMTMLMIEKKKHTMQIDEFREIKEEKPSTWLKGC